MCSGRTTSDTFFITEAVIPRTPASRCHKSVRKWATPFRRFMFPKPSTMICPSPTTARDLALSPNMWRSPPKKRRSTLSPCAQRQPKYSYWKSWGGMPDGLPVPVHWRPHSKATPRTSSCSRKSRSTSSASWIRWRRAWTDTAIALSSPRRAPAQQTVVYCLIRASGMPSDTRNWAAWHPSSLAW